MSRTIEQIGLTMLRWGSKRPCAAATSTQLDCAVPQPASCRQATNQRGANWPRWYLADETR